MAEHVEHVKETTARNAKRQSEKGKAHKPWKDILQKENDSHS